MDIFGVVFTIAILTTSVEGAGDTAINDCLPSVEAVTAVAHRLTRLVEHYRGHEAGLNVDGLYGMRIAQGALAASILTAGNEGDRWQHLRAQLVNLSHSINELSMTTDALLQQMNAEYYNLFKPVVGYPFSVNATPHRLESNLLDTQQVPEQQPYNETHGDICMEKLMGTYRPPSHSYKCFINKDCLKMMSKEMQTEYTSTHQLLYFIFAQKMGCESLVNELIAPTSIDAVQKKLCQRILVDNDQLIKNSTPRVSVLDIDVFIEQAVLCTMLGFTNFLDEEKMEAVIEHQDERTGCYLLPPGYQVQRSQRHARSMFIRTKRKSKLDKDLCRSHCTGLAAAYMGLFIQYAVLPASQTTCHTQL